MNPEVKGKAIGILDTIEGELFEINQWLHEHPELGGEEFSAVEKLTGILEAEGFHIQKGSGGLPTAFTATSNLGGEGLAIGFMAEYDALPKIGHGCGHNNMAASSLGAAILLKRLLQGQGGRIIVLGTPAEETIGGKIFMVNEGVFAGIHLAMSVHSANRTTVGGSSLASHPLEIRFSGKAAHAAAAPQEGINALDAMIETYIAIRALKNHLRDDVRIPGIITDGGTAPNIVPDRAVGRFSIRAADSRYLETVIEKVKNCAQGAALATGAEVDFHHYEPLFEAMVNNRVMGDVFSRHLQDLGYDVSQVAENYRGGSTDVGNVSQVVPTIHPSIRIGPEWLQAHTQEFADFSVMDEAKRAIRASVLAMVLTVMDIREDQELYSQIRREFEKKTHCLVNRQCAQTTFE